MNIKSILLSVLALAVISAVAFTTNTEKKDNSYFVKAKAEKSLKEAAEAAGSAAFFQEMRANPITGKIEVKDVESVIRQINRQQNDANKTTALGMLEWEERGPDNIGGRTRGMMCDINDSNKFYMGQVSGGFWSSTDRGNTWSKIAGADSSTRMSVSCMTQTSNGDIYYGTGEGFANISGIGHFGGIPGGGIFKSTDGGLTSVSLAQTRPAFDNDNGTWTYINRLAADPTNGSHVYAAINRGLYETKDGGTTWTKALSPTPEFLDVDVSANGQVILASSAGQMYLSTDGGANFALGINSTTVGLPGASGINRIEVAIAPSNENVMYCVMSASNGNQLKGVYKSTDKGANWSAIGVGGSQVFNPLGSQGAYNIALGVHPTNPDMIFVGGQLDLYRYTPQNLWEPIAYWAQSAQTGKKVHADMHGIMFNIANADEMYVVTDGGFFRTADCTETSPFFVEKNKNYATAQCYGVAANNLGHIIFGTQDNGTNLINGGIANSPNASKDAMGGDGMRGAASDIDPDFLYGTSQNGVLRGSADGGTSMASYKSSFDENIDAAPSPNSTPDGRPDEGGPWISPVTLAENADGSFTKSVLFIGLNDNVWFTQQAVGTKPKVWFPLHTSGGAGYSAIAVSKDGKTAFVGTLGGALYRITGIDLFGTRYLYDDTTTNLLVNGFAMGSSIVATQLASPWGGLVVTDIETNATGSEIIVTVPRYGVANHVYRSVNALSATPTITSIQGNLPRMPVYSAAILNQPNSYIVGTDLGVWGTDNGGTSWTELNNIGGPESMWHPRCATMQIAVKPFLNTAAGGQIGEIIYTGTYGRGTFMSKTRSAFWPVSTNTIEGVENSLKVYPNPVNTTANIQYNVSKSSEAMIKVISLTGRVIKTTFVKLSSGENKIGVDLSAITNGVFMISVSSTNGTATTKIVKR